MDLEEAAALRRPHCEFELQTDETTTSVGTMNYLYVLGCGLLLGSAAYFLQAADANVKSGVLSLAGLVLAAVVTNAYAKAREVHARHFPEKTEAYGKIMDLIFSIIGNIKSKNKHSDSDLKKLMLDFKKSMMIWGSAETIRLWNEIETVTNTEGQNPETTMAVMEQLLRAIRKDLGQDDQSLQFGELLKLIIVPEEKDKMSGLRNLR